MITKRADSNPSYANTMDSALSKPQETAEKLVLLSDAVQNNPAFMLENQRANHSNQGKICMKIYLNEYNMIQSFCRRWNCCYTFQLLQKYDSVVLPCTMKYNSFNCVIANTMLAILITVKSCNHICVIFNKIFEISINRIFNTYHC